MNKQTPAAFAADAINAVKGNLKAITADGLSPKDAIAATQVLALNGIAAALLAVADAVSEGSGTEGAPDAVRVRDRAAGLPPRPVA